MFYSIINKLIFIVILKWLFMGSLIICCENITNSFISINLSERED